MKNIRIFYLEIFPFLVVKFSIYLNRRVFVMVPYDDALLLITSRTMEKLYVCCLLTFNDL